MAEQNMKSSSSSSRQRLHNFVFTRNVFNWGAQQRSLRCLTTNTNPGYPTVVPDQQRSSFPPAIDHGDEVAHKQKLDVSSVTYDEKKLTYQQKSGEIGVSKGVDHMLRRGRMASDVGWPKFSITLTKEEIEADFIAITGAKPPRRPKVKRNLDELAPGHWLGEVTPEKYKVDDEPKPRKGRK